MILLSLTGCTVTSNYGPCVGLLNTLNPVLSYRLSEWHVTFTITDKVFVTPPIYLMIKKENCPVVSNETK